MDRPEFTCVPNLVAHTVFNEKSYRKAPSDGGLTRINLGEIVWILKTE